jgi:hypothetical protein
MKLRKMLSRVWRLLKRDKPPHDPYTGVRVPLKRGPAGRSSAIAVPEPDSE